MRGVVLAAALLAPLVAASHEPGVLLDWQHGDALVGTTPLLMSPLAPAFSFEVDACRRDLFVDLLYEPAERGADVDRVGEAFLRFDFLVEVRSGGSVVASRHVRAPSYGIPLGQAPAAATHEIALSLANGANVSWDLRVRGMEAFGEIACEPRVVVNEVEANPAGIDAGFEWIELHNAGAEAADLSLWTLRATHGAPAELTLPEGLAIAPGGHLVVAFSAGQFLDNVDEVVELRDALGRLRDATPALDDGENDGDTWQRSTDGAPDWLFASGTPGGSNG